MVDEVLPDDAHSLEALPDEAPPASSLPGGAIDVVIEIPRGSRNKYEYDHGTDRIWLDRRLFSATVYPADYGFIPDTLAEDGDPLDALVLADEPVFPGVWVLSRPVGLLWMTDEKGPDAKVICVPEGDTRWEGVRDITDLPAELRAEIEHFFMVYKDLEPEKTATTAGFDGVKAAWAEIEASVRRFAAGPESPPTD
jgi:inorganic pyrophosphatase